MADENEQTKNMTNGTISKLTELTPNTLDEAIKMELTTGPLNTIADRLYWRMKDFMADKMTSIAYRAHVDKMPADIAIQLLFDEIIRR